MTGLTVLIDANGEFTVRSDCPALVLLYYCIDFDGSLHVYSGVYVLLTNLSNASPDATWNSHKPELAISPPFLTRRP